MSTFGDAARAALARAAAPTSMEELWRRAALETVATGRLTEPPATELKRLTTPALVWTGIAPWPIDVIQDRIARLFDSHRLAIATGDRDWLEQLDQAWKAAPDTIDEARLRAEGEIGLALGSRPGGWTPDEIESLAEELIFVPTFAVDRAWLSLAAGDPAKARRALAEHEAELADAARAWELDPERGLRFVMTHPGTALRVEPRALHALLDRAARRRH